MITGDAMHVLDALAKIPDYADRYLGKIKLVYIDPPFNTGQAFPNYEDNIEHSIWLTMLRDRLRQIKPLLAPDASIWVHLDDSEVHRCRLVMDEELGMDKFVATIVWQKRYSRENRPAIGEVHDSIHVYSPAGSQWKRARNKLPRLAAKEYRNPNNDPRGPWRIVPMTAPGTRPNQMYEILGPDGTVHLPPSGRCWSTIESGYWQLVEQGRIRFGITGRGAPGILRYLDEDEGLTPWTWWPHEETGHTDESKKEMQALFPDEDPFDTPKPERLLERIIRIASNPGDIILDCYAGSATTAAVAHKLGRKWVTCELQASSVDKYAKPRLRKVIMGDDPGGVTSRTVRVPAVDDQLPASLTPKDAQDFNRVLNALVKAGAAHVDTQSLKSLRSATRTREHSAIAWHGGGGFTHLEVGPSMFDELAGMVVLAEWATHNALTEAMCAQLGTRYEPDGVFAGRHGRRRLAVIDGMVGAATIDAVVEQLVAGENVELWATQVDEDAAARLKELRPGSRLHRIPSAVLDTYRRRTGERTPFGGQRTAVEEEA